MAWKTSLSFFGCCGSKGLFSRAVAVSLLGECQKYQKNMKQQKYLGRACSSEQMSKNMAMFHLNYEQMNNCLELSTSQTQKSADFLPFGHEFIDWSEDCW